MEEIRMKKYFVFTLLVVCMMLSGCNKNVNTASVEQPHLYWKEIEVEVIDIDKRHWFASTHQYIVNIDVYSNEYNLSQTFEIKGSGAFGCPKEYNYNVGDKVKAELYSWKMDSTGEIIEREIHNLL